ncbi:MAG: GGDEF domain-containing protein [Myxococcota bacterium]|jgi:diguanylate cyclase (GGDEF)-like protein
MTPYSKSRLAAFVMDRSPVVLVAFAAVITAFIGIVDNITAESINFSIFYVLPVAFMVWFVSIPVGVIFCVASSLIMVGDVLTASVLDTTTLWNSMVHLAFFITIMLILAKLKTAYNRERLLSRTDPLTGCANKLDFNERAEMEIERLRRYSRQFSIAYVDMDNFKAVNDRWGHETGDELLRSFADTVRSNVRKLDLFARLGGDEFVILLPELDETAARQLMERIDGFFLEIMRSRNWPTTLSVGLITYTRAPASVATMLGKADELMYAAKKGGKNSIQHLVS